MTKTGTFSPSPTNDHMAITATTVVNGEIARITKTEFERASYVTGICANRAVQA